MLSAFSTEIVTSFADVPAADAGCVPAFTGLTSVDGTSEGPAEGMRRSPSFTTLSVRMLLSLSAEERLGLNAPLDPRRCLQGGVQNLCKDPH